MQSAEAPEDSDHDDMPDEWERKNELNPRDFSEANKDRNGDGYTNIEEYLHSLLKPAQHLLTSVSRFCKRRIMKRAVFCLFYIAFVATAAAEAPGGVLPLRLQGQCACHSDRS